MKEMLEFLLSSIIIVPYLLTFALFAISKVSGYSTVRSFRIAADVTVVFLLLSVNVLLEMILGIQAGIYSVSGILVIGIGFAVAERVRSKEFRVNYMLRNIWRMLFLVLSMLYVVLLLLGVVQTVADFLRT